MTELSEYERVRMENIARNEMFLKDIGLPSQPKSSAPKKGKVGTGAKRRVERVHIDGERKSSRIRNAPVKVQGLSYAESDDDNDELFEEKQGSSSKVGSSKKRKKKVSTREIVMYETKVVSMSTTKSSREVDSNYGIFIGCDASCDHLRYDASTGTLSGSPQASSANFKEENGKWVRIADGDEILKKSTAVSKDNKFKNNNCGRMLEEVGFGKAAIMAASYFGTAPKFSKYSGVVEWKNCVYLWVNIGVPGGDYNNSFSEGGRYITWFGGSRMHADTPVTQRLLNGGGSETVLLWVRLEKEPYTCLGPVKVVESDVEVHPITMKWELLLYEPLKAKAEECNFTAVLAENDPPISI